MPEVASTHVQAARAGNCTGGGDEGDEEAILHPHWWRRRRWCWCWCWRAAVLAVTDRHAVVTVTESEVSSQVSQTQVSELSDIRG